MVAVFDPKQWGTFFSIVGTGSAALTGLVFVAMSINLRSIARDATYKYRAINMLTGLTGAFLLSALAEMGHQTTRSLGVEWLVESVVSTVVNTNGYVQGYRLSGSRFALNAFRIAGGSACYAGQVVGAILLCAGRSSGADVAAIALVANFYFLISGSWLLIAGTLSAE